MTEQVRRKLRQYPDELKAQVIGAWLAGTASQGALARKYGVPRQTVVTWLRRLPARQVLIQDKSLEEQFARPLYHTAMEARDALGAHLRAAATPEFAGVIEGWTDRASGLSRTVVNGASELLLQTFVLY